MIRFCCKLKEFRRQQMYEKALDACATSPFARSVKRWVLAGAAQQRRVWLAASSWC